MKKPEFEVLSGKDEKWYYRLKAANGEPIMSGRVYSSKYSVMHGIAHVMENGIEQERFTLKRSANHKFYFQLRSKSGRIIGWSELYETEEDRNADVARVQEFCQSGSVATEGGGKKPKFEIFKTNEGKFQFQLKAANGEPVMTGRAYEAKYNLMHAIAQVMKETQREIRFVRKTSANYKFFFQLRSQTGRLIGWSQLYQTRQGRDNGIVAVMNAAKFAQVKDITVI